MNTRQLLGLSRRVSTRVASAPLISSRRTFKTKNIASKPATTTTTGALADNNNNDNNVSGSSANAYLKSLNNQELFSYGVIGLSTLNKPILDLVIKLFPYVPMFLVKLLVYKNYCGGETIEEVKKTGLRLSERGIKNMMISLTIEGCDGNDNIDSAFIIDETNKSVSDILIPHTLTMIEDAIAKGESVNDVPSGYVALKPTGMIEDAANVLRHFQNAETDYPAKFDQLVKNSSDIIETIYNKNVELAKQYPERVAPFVVGVIDAERYELQPGVYELQRRLYKQFNPVNKPVSVVGTLQMYLKDSSKLLTFEKEVAQNENYRLGLKLVRGAYIHSEPERAVIHQNKKDTDVNYDNGIKSSIQDILSSTKANESVIGHLVVASHNGDSQLKATEQLKSTTNAQKSNIVLGQLLGMADNVTYNLISKYQISNIIKYVPWGPPLETKDYLLRRLEENGDAVRADNGWPLVKGVTSTLFSRLFKN